MAVARRSKTASSFIASCTVGLRRYSIRAPSGRVGILLAVTAVPRQWRHRATQNMARREVDHEETQLRNRPAAKWHIRRAQYRTRLAAKSNMRTSAIRKKRPSKRRCCEAPKAASRRRHNVEQHSDTRHCEAPLLRSAKGGIT
jgi:hypothetical protein